MKEPSTGKSESARAKMEIRGLKALTLLQLLLQAFVFLFGTTTLAGTVCFLTVFPTFARQPIHVATNVSYREIETLQAVDVSAETFLDPIIVDVDSLPLPKRPLPDVGPERVAEDEDAPAPTNAPLPPRDLGARPSPPTNLTAN